MKRVIGIETTAILSGRAEQYHGVTINEVLRTALEKAREEGRKEGRLSGYNEMKAVCDNSVPMWKEEAITQYKEELLGNLPKEIEDTRVHPFLREGFNECLSEVKKLLRL